MDQDQLVVHQCCTTYDIERTVEAIRKSGLPGEFAQMLQCGKNFNQVRLEQAGTQALERGGAPGADGTPRSSPR